MKLFTFPGTSASLPKQIGIQDMEASGFLDDLEDDLKPFFAILSKGDAMEVCYFTILAKDRTSAYRELMKQNPGCYFMPDYDDRITEITEGDIITPKTLNKWKNLHYTDFVYWPEGAEMPYQKADFLRLCKGNIKHSFMLFGVCEWQTPEAIIGEYADGIEEMFGKY